jgi:hypothetical protein
MLLPKRHQIKHLEFVVPSFGTRGSEVQILSPRCRCDDQFHKRKASSELRAPLAMTGQYSHRPCRSYFTADTFPTEHKEVTGMRNLPTAHAKISLTLARTCWMGDCHDNY